MKSAWGIDFGTHAAKAVKLDLTPTGVQAATWVKVAHDVPLSDDFFSAKEPSHIIQTISEMVVSFLTHDSLGREMTKHPVVIGLPQKYVIARFAKLPPIDPKRLHDIINYEAQYSIPFSLEEVNWDYHVSNEKVFDVDRAAEACIFAIKHDLRSQVTEPFVQAGINPVSATPVAIALYNTLMYDLQLLEDMPIAFVELCGDNTNILVATSRDFWTRSIPIGGNYFTRMLAKALNISTLEAENWKRKAHGVSTAENYKIGMEAMLPAFQELTKQIQQSIRFYNATRPQRKILKIVCVGAGFRLPGLIAYIEKQIGHSISDDAVVSVQNIQFHKLQLPRTQTILQDAIPCEYANAVGLALQGLKQSAVSINLMPNVFSLSKLFWHVVSLRFLKEDFNYR